MPVGLPALDLTEIRVRQDYSERNVGLPDEEREEFCVPPELGDDGAAGGALGFVSIQVDVGARLGYLE